MYLMLDLWSGEVQAAGMQALGIFDEVNSEVGHIIVAESKGFDAEFDGVTLVYPKAEMTDAQHRLDTVLDMINRIR